MDNSTPQAICKLAYELLDIKKNDKVADLGCGKGTFIDYVLAKQPKTDIYGYDIDEKAVENLSKSDIDKNVHIECKDAFELFKEGKSFDKIFFNYPLNAFLNYGHNDNDYLEELYGRIPGMNISTISDWKFNSLLCDLISSKGKAVAVTSHGSLGNTKDKKIRQYFIENGLIECVLQLPDKMFGGLITSSALIVFSHGNKGVKLIDGTESLKEGRRINDISDEDIEKLVENYKNSDENFISLEELKKTEFDLNYKTYKKPETSESSYNGPTCKFEDVILKITRGAQIKAEDLDRITIGEPTEYQYLMLANIQNGMINDDLPYITEINEKDLKYCIKTDDVILSKMGAPYKVAVAEVPDGKKILGNGNLYIIELDKNEMDPFFLKAYLESKEGISKLESITVGTTIPSIGVDRLKKLIIPKPDMDTQKKIAADYKNAYEDIKRLSNELEAAKKRLSEVVTF